MIQNSLNFTILSYDFLVHLFPAHWDVISGVPGLGCSIYNRCNSSASTLKLWEESTEKKLSLSEKILKFFSHKRKKKFEPLPLESNVTLIELPKASIRRSASSVTTSQRSKVSDKERKRCCNISCKNNIGRSQSLNKIRQETIDKSLVLL